MQKVLDWSVPNSTEIKNENVGSILLHVNPLTSVPAVAVISDLNKIQFGLSLKRGNNKEISIYDGYLGDFLQHIYGGSTKLETVIEATSVGYLFNLEFKRAINVGPNDVLTVKTNFGAPSNAFTSGVLSGSTIVVYTNPSPVSNPQNYIPIFKDYPVGTGETHFEKHLGNNVSKIIFCHHATATFNASTQAKPLTAEITADGYIQDKEQVELLAANQMLIAYNPDSDVKNLVIYDSPVLLNNVRAKIKLDIAAVSYTKVLTTSYMMY